MKKQILGKNGMEKAISQISEDIIAGNSDPTAIIMIGVKKRGDVLAKRIAQRIESIKKEKIGGLSAIDITFYRDDVRLKAYKYASKEGNDFNVRDEHVILVDDVIDTGRSIRAAIDAIIDSGRPRTIQLAVMIDKGYREIPIQPDYVGKKIETDPNTEILVKLKEVDGEDRIVIIDHKK